MVAKTSYTLITVCPKQTPFLVLDTKAKHPLAISAVSVTCASIPDTAVGGTIGDNNAPNFLTSLRRSNAASIALRANLYKFKPIHRGMTFWNIRLTYAHPPHLMLS